MPSRSPESDPPEKIGRYGVLESEWLLTPESERISPEYDKPTCSLEQVAEPIERESGTYTEYLATFPDGMTYGVFFGKPKEEKTEVTAVFGTPWMTSFDIDGLNGLLAQDISSLGMGTMIIGSEGYTPLEEGATAPIKPKLEYSAANLLSIFEQAQKEGLIKSDKMVYEGMSRSANMGIAVAALAPLFDVDLVFADIKAPIYADKFDPTSPRDVLELGIQAAMEAFAVGALFRFVRNNEKSVAATVNPRPRVLRHELGKIGSFMSGDVGKFLKALPKNTAATVTEYFKDLFSKRSAFEGKSKKNHGVFYKTRPGGHLEGLVSDESRREYAARVKLLMEGSHLEGDELVNWLRFVAHATREDLNILYKETIVLSEPFTTAS
jgi:hypothetical protein